MKTDKETDLLEGIAIVGMSVRFPGAPSVDRFWRNLCDGVESLTTFTDAQLLSAGVDPALLASPGYVKAGLPLEGFDLFDADFFGFTPREAEATDPQHRIFLECAWEALENAGYDPDQYAGRIGVFAGSGTRTFYHYLVTSSRHLTKLLGNVQTFIAIEKDFLTTRVSYELNLRGPSLSVQTACSTSLVAVHLACQSLLNGESDMVLAGGVTVRLPQIAGYSYQEGSIHSPDGHCRAFDAQAQGTVFGSGAGIVVLKRLADAQSDGDRIHAVILGSCINNDGAGKVGYTAPSVDGQARVIAEAQAMAGVTADQITYIETHGTGTALGDPIEVAALTKAFRTTTQNRSFCAIGSVKPNIGHLDAAAGVAGLIKAALALENRILPPSLNFNRPNPAIDFANSPFYVQQTLSEWQPSNGRRLAGVSSFGIGGTNAHVVLEEPPAVEPSGTLRSAQLLMLSAKTPAALEKMTADLAIHLKTHPNLDLADMAYTLQMGRRAMPFRRVLVCHDIEDAVAQLEKPDPQRVFTQRQQRQDASVVFMFPGQGSQYVGMGADLYRCEPVFRAKVDRCAEFLLPIVQADLRSVMFADGLPQEQAQELLVQTRFTQPALFVLEYALAQLWMSWGIRPAAMIGHSVGEYVAGCLAGIFSLEDALTLIAERARLVQQQPGGAMIAVRLSESKVASMLNGNRQSAVAAINSPELCVVAGPHDEIASLEEKLASQGIVVRRLHTSHAFHSPMMDPVLEPFTEVLRRVSLKAPKIPYVSNVTGQWITPAEATDPHYWAHHARQPVRFSDGIAQFLRDAPSLLLEVGPGQTLSTLARLHPDHRPEQTVLNSVARDKELESILTACGRLWITGLNIDGAAFFAHETRHRVPLPTYPFDRKRYWPEPNEANSAAQPMNVATSPAIPFYSSPQSRAEYGAQQNVAREALAPNGKLDRKAQPASEPDVSPDASGYVPPQDEFERLICEAWAEVLGLKRVGVRDNFFDLGGNSLSALQLVLRLQQIIPGEPLPLRALLDAPTIEQFAVWLRNIKTDEHQFLVRMRPGTSERRPFFCVHGAGGNVLNMRALAMALPADLPFYCFQDRGLDGSEPFESVEETAYCYVDEILRVQPHGPYCIGGTCHGGRVAFEMARRLEELGESVAALVLIDSFNYAFLTDMSKRDQLLRNTRFFLRRGAWHARRMLSQSPGEWLAYLKGRRNALRKRMRDFATVVADVEAEMIEAVPSNSLGEKLTRVIHANIIASTKFVPKPYRGDALIFRASTNKLNPYDDYCMGWKPVVRGRIECFEIEGDHMSILEQPAVQLMAERLNARLA